MAYGEGPPFLSMDDYRNFDPVLNPANWTITGVPAIPAPQICPNDFTIPRVRRSWGQEVWWVNNDLYCLKSLLVLPGQKLPVHMHFEKDEVIMLGWGKPERPLSCPSLIIFNDKTMYPESKALVLHGDQIRISKGTFHSFINTTNEMVELVEVSTPHNEDDVYFTQDEPSAYQWAEVKKLLEDEEKFIGPIHAE